MPTETETLVNPTVVQDAVRIAERFALREPFRHVVIDNFLNPAFADSLLTDFPTFEKGNARNEAGELGNKSTVQRIRSLAPSYRELDDLIKSRGFLDLIGKMTGINDLLYDQFYFGGGTHENREGQDLDPHIDFNRHPVENWYCPNQASTLAGARSHRTSIPETDRAMNWPTPIRQSMSSALCLITLSPERPSIKSMSRN